MRVLVTGHLGYIGPIVVRRFKQAGHFVAGIDTGYFRDALASDADVAPDVEIRKDVRQIDGNDISGFDCIVLLAALSNDPMGELSADLTMQINHQASVNIARLAKAAGVQRFIFASSCSLYGAASTDRPLTEEAPFNPVSAYALSKALTEGALRDLADENFSPVCMRNATAFGVSPRMRFDLVLNNLMAWATLAQRVRVTSDGTPWRPLVHIEDIAHAMLCAAEAPRSAVHNESFNIGRTDCNYRIRDIAVTVAREVPGATLEITGESSGDPRSYRVDFSKAARQLPGFSPTWTLERGCRQIADWFASRHESVESFQSRQFVRLKQLKHLLEQRQLTSALFWADAG